MRVLFTLTSAESRRLIAKGVIASEPFKRAWESAYVIFAGGTTNGMLLQELPGLSKTDPAKATFGITADGVICLTAAADRVTFPRVWYKGQPSAKSVSEALREKNPDTIVIKGGNAVDPQGNIGVLTASDNGGTISAFYGSAVAQGLTMLMPVGLEKLVPSVPAAAKACSVQRIDIAMGSAASMFCITTAAPVTEIEALQILFGVETTVIACGGTGDSAGAVTLLCEGSETDVRSLVAFLEKEIKGEPAIRGRKGICTDCTRKECRYNGMSEEAFPWKTSRNNGAFSE